MIKSEQEDVILEAKDLHFSYDMEEEHSLNGINIRIGRGKKIAFMGANGSGKSTFFLCCNGIHKPQQGEILFDGQPVSYNRAGLLKLRSKVGIVFQDPDNQLFLSSVSQEIAFGILNQRVPEEEARREVDKVIEQLGIASFADRPTHALSGGQKKQVCIADILVMKPEIIILDEPAAALDPQHTKLVDDMISQFSEQGITIMMATHNMDYAYEWADEIVLMHEGRVLCQDTALSICSNQELLDEAGLDEPVVLTLYGHMLQSGKIKAGKKPPANVNELIGYMYEERNE